MDKDFGNFATEGGVRVRTKNIQSTAEFRFGGDCGCYRHGKNTCSTIVPVGSRSNSAKNVDVRKKHITYRLDRGRRITAPNICVN